MQSPSGRATTYRASCGAFILVIACAFGAVPAAHQNSAAPPSAAAPAGHWVGAIEAGAGIEVEIDLAMKSAGVWYGTISIPSQGTRGVPLSELTVKGPAVSFAIKGAPGDPQYSGTLAQDGKSITGTFMQGGGSVPLRLTWKGEAKFDVPAKSTAIGKELEGTWEGTLDVKGTTLRLVLKLANGAGGATGTLISVDQNNVELPVSTITQEGTRVTLLINMISGTYAGELQEGALTGTWTQGPLSLPLVFKRPAK
ncbi:MAG TPA: hypothetical protein VFJ02_02400 [Vicinamibacterales bacterium]|nr:hypothetical protein [Vicinamibacterales bacterium]